MVSMDNYVSRMCFSVIDGKHNYFSFINKNKIKYVAQEYGSGELALAFSP